MKRIMILLLSLGLVFSCAGCAWAGEENGLQESSAGQDVLEEGMNVQVRLGELTLTAVLENNATTRAIFKQLPMTLPMLDLYDRELCYRYGANALPVDTLRDDGYEVGDLVYWPPGGSFVILYAQNGEQFERQQLGHIEEGAERIAGIGDTEVTFTLIEDEGEEE